MAIEFQCGHCSQTLRVSDEHAGKRAKCPNCQTVNSVPAGGRPSAQMVPNAGNEAYFDENSAAGTHANSNPYSASNVVVGGRSLAPHRGSLVLTLGVFALLCNLMLVPGILAWIFGRSDLKEIDAGRMDPQGRGITQAGMVLGIIGTALPLVIMALYIIFFVVLMLFGVAGAAAAG